jgi:ABC-type transporter Mla subunit MlaD
MAKTISQFKLGLFILVCGSLGLIAIIWLGASHYFEEKHIYVTYFAESIKGLQKDAVVNYLGVPVGRVASVGVAPDGRLIEVVLHLKPEFNVDQSLAIRLLEQGLTGLRYLEIVAAPKDTRELTPQIGFPPANPLIPSYPSEITHLKANLENLYAKVIELDLQGLVESWKKTGQSAGSILADEKLAATLQNLKAGSEDLQSLLGRLNAATSGGNLERGIQDLNKTLAASRRSLETLAKQLDRLPPDALANLNTQLDQILKTGTTTIAGWEQETGKVLASVQQNLDHSKQVLEQLRQLVQALRAQPQQILFHPATPDPFQKK